MALKVGKVPRDVLSNVLSVIDWTSDRSVLLGPGEGLDAAVIEINGKKLVMASDPVTGAGSRAGFYAVHVNANDVAVLGARPRWMLLTILLPKGSEAEEAVKIERDAVGAASPLGVTVVGGHTEVTPGLRNPIVSGAMVGTVEKTLVLPNGARQGDVILVTKWIGLEGTSIVAWHKREDLSKEFGRKFVRRALGFSGMVSVVREALKAAELGVNAMHDPTEGGLANGLHEMADAAGVGFRIWEDKIPLREETIKICEFYDLDPLSLLSSGSLLISAPKDLVPSLTREIKKLGIKITVIGEFTREGRTIVRNGVEHELPRPEMDEVWKIVG